MKKTAKDTLVSVIVLFSISFICVALLAVANEYLRYEAKLDTAMAKWLYSVCPTGEASDENALEYFEIMEADEVIESINSEFGSPTVSVIAVYRAVKGENQGSYIVQAQSRGHVDNVVMLTAYDSEGRILKTRCYSQSESFWSNYDESKFDLLAGESGEITQADIQTGTGATNTRNAIARALTISNRTAERLTGGNNA